MRRELTGSSRLGGCPIQCILLQISSYFSVLGEVCEIQKKDNDGEDDEDSSKIHITGNHYAFI